MARVLAQTAESDVVAKTDWKRADAILAAVDVSGTPDSFKRAYLRFQSLSRRSSEVDELLKRYDESKNPSDLALIRSFIREMEDVEAAAPDAAVYEIGLINQGVLNAHAGNAFEDALRVAQREGVLLPPNLELTNYRRERLADPR